MRQNATEIRKLALLGLARAFLRIAEPRAGVKVARRV